MRRMRYLFPLVAMALTGALIAPLGVADASTPQAPMQSGRYIVTARSASELAGLRQRAVDRGAKVVLDLRKLNSFVIEGSSQAVSATASDRSARAVSADGIHQITMADRQTPTVRAPGRQSAQVVGTSAPAQPAASRADPAVAFPGLLWDYGRMGVQEAWAQRATGQGVTVAVEDTGIDFTHSELADRVTQVIDLAEDDNLCRRFFGASDQMLADQFGGPVSTDWNGHGSWIAGSIAAALDRKGTNGIAYNADLVSVKISQWCGFASSSTIAEGFIEAADAGVDILNISFGGYSDRSTPNGEHNYQIMADAVQYARDRGMVIVASAGNEHTRIGAGGEVLSHGQLTAPRAEAVDLFGLFQTPGGVPGVVDVAATNNEVIGPSRGCPEGTAGTPEAPNATCKPRRDAHQPFGVGSQNQLSYYSNYGPRIDVAGPGGGRKFNLPVWDRGGTPGFPYTDDDLTRAFETFSTTSNWAMEIPCFTFTEGSGFYPGECYSTIQGTSMAAPHAAAALAIIASANPDLVGDPDALIAALKANAIIPGTNNTPPVSASDTSPADLTNVHCPTGFCHLGGTAISNAEAYGAGLVNVASP